MITSRGLDVLPSFANLKTNRQYPDSKVDGANMEHTWVLSAPDGPHVGPMNLAIRVPQMAALFATKNTYTIPSVAYFCWLSYPSTSVRVMTKWWFPNISSETCL